MKITPYLTNESPEILEIARLLGLPPNVLSFTLQVRNGEFPVVTCEFYPPDTKLEDPKKGETNVEIRFEPTLMSEGTRVFRDSFLKAVRDVVQDGVHRHG